jgi:hypothetical protein
MTDYSTKLKIKSICFWNVASVVPFSLEAAKC